MAGIYIHIPFCRKACHYCNFHFSTSLALKSELLAALSAEIEMTAASPDGKGSYLGGEPVDTIYFGGGTPSLLSGKELNGLLQKLASFYRIGPLAEITLEANPDDIHPGKVAEWKEAGINRLSIGVQSFFDEDLLWMNRAHTAEQAMQSLVMAQDSGLNNITIDLIFGTPGLTDARWKENVQRAISMGIPHLSCYALTVEPSTALQRMISQKKSPDIDPEKQASQFMSLMHWLETAGYEHSEVSNFARPGRRSRHNSSYWQGKKYLGLGPSAHSFNGITRHWNISNNVLYIESIKNSILPVETETLTVTQQLNEYIMTSLRTMEGLGRQYVNERFGQEVLVALEEAAGKFIGDGRMQSAGDRLQLTKKGILYADGIAAEMFFGE